MESLKARIINYLTYVITLRQETIAYNQSRANLRQFGADSSIGRNPEIYSPEYISIGNGVRIGNNIRLQAITTHQGQVFKPSIIIEDGVSIENNCAITANNSVLLKENVMIAGNVFISDHEHSYRDPAVPIKSQSLTITKGIIIGAGSHIGQNVAIFAGVEVGEHAVVGANSVVTGDIPSYCVAVGAPARIVKRYDTQTKEWIKP